MRGAPRLQPTIRQNGRIGTFRDRQVPGTVMAIPNRMSKASAFNFGLQTSTSFWTGVLILSLNQS